MRIFTLTLGFCLVLLHGVSSAQPSRSAFINRLVFNAAPVPAQTASRLSNAFSKPGTSQEFSWPNATAGWLHFANNAYLYTSDGRIMQKTSATLGGQPTEQFSYSYQGPHLTEKLRKIWAGNSWLNDTREVYVYNASGDLTELRYESWYNGAWTIDDGSRYLRTYNATGQLTSLVMQTWAFTWENAVRETYTLSPANTWTEVTVDLWDQAAWQPSEKITNLVWHNWSQRELQGYLLQTFSQNTWVNAENAAFTYALTQKELRLDQPVVNGWEPKYRYTQFFDPQGNSLGFLDQELLNNTWVRHNEVRHLLQYDASLNVTEQISQVLDYNNQTMVNSSKSVFQNFQSFNISGTCQEMAAGAIKVYPNPAAAFLTVAVTNGQFQLASATILDLSGRKVLSQDLEKNIGLPEARINIAHLPAGVYLLQLSSARGEQLQQRLVKN